MKPRIEAFQERTIEEEMMISATYIGHATTLIKVGETNFLTDPHFGKKLFIMKRRVPLSFNPGKLPNIDAILLTHLHYDHLHIGSFQYISCKTPIICPPGSGRYLEKFLANPIIEIDYYANYRLPSGEEIIALPSNHKGSRINFFNRMRTSAYLVKSKHGNFYFCGDSGYGPHFSEASSLCNIDLAFLPIGAYLPKIIQKWHMDPPHALKAFKDLKAKHMIPTHHSIFKLSLERPEEPRRWLEGLITKNSKLKNKIHNLMPGEQIDIEVEKKAAS